MSLEQIEWVAAHVFLITIGWFILLGFLSIGGHPGSGSSEFGVAEWIFFGIPVIAFLVALLVIGGINAWEWLVINYPKE